MKPEREGRFGLSAACRRSRPQGPARLHRRASGQNNVRGEYPIQHRAQTGQVQDGLADCLGKPPGNVVQRSPKLQVDYAALIHHAKDPSTIYDLIEYTVQS